jgi:hypothetical protein
MIYPHSLLGQTEKIELHLLQFDIGHVVEDYKLKERITSL